MNLDASFCERKAFGKQPHKVTDLELRRWVMINIGMSLLEKCYGCQSYALLWWPWGLWKTSWRKSGASYSICLHRRKVKLWMMNVDDYRQILLRAKGALNLVD